MKTSVSQISKRRNNTWLGHQKSMNKLVELAVTMNLNV